MTRAGRLADLGITIAALLVPALAFIAAFPQRTDYVGHYLAGAGGTAVLLGVVVAATGGRPWLVVAVTALAVLLGVGTEATVFLIAIFDPVDLANQSLGAVIVGASVVGAARSLRHGVGLFALGMILLVAGFRYAFA